MKYYFDRFVKSRALFFAIVLSVAAVNALAQETPEIPQPDSPQMNGAPSVDETPPIPEMIETYEDVKAAYQAADVPPLEKIAGWWLGYCYSKPEAGKPDLSGESVLLTASVYSRRDSQAYLKFFIHHGNTLPAVDKKSYKNLGFKSFLKFFGMGKTVLASDVLAPAILDENELISFSVRENDKGELEPATAWALKTKDEFIYGKVSEEFLSSDMYCKFKKRIR